MKTKPQSDRLCSRTLALERWAVLLPPRVGEGWSYGVRLAEFPGGRLNQVCRLTPVIPACGRLGQKGPSQVGASAGQHSDSQTRKGRLRGLTVSVVAQLCLEKRAGLPPAADPAAAVRSVSGSMQGLVLLPCLRWKQGVP